MSLPRGSKVVPFCAVYHNPEEENRSQPKRNYFGVSGYPLRLLEPENERSITYMAGRTTRRVQSQPFVPSGSKYPTMNHTPQIIAQSPNPETLDTRCFGTLDL